VTKFSIYVRTGIGVVSLGTWIIVSLILEDKNAPCFVVSPCAVILRNVTSTLNKDWLYIDWPYEQGIVIWSLRGTETTVARRLASHVLNYIDSKVKSEKVKKYAYSVTVLRCSLCYCFQIVSSRNPYDQRKNMGVGCGGEGTWYIPRPVIFFFNFEVAQH